MKMETTNTWYGSELGLTEDQIIELGHISTSNDAGRHFTTCSRYFSVLEERGAIVIHRPVHVATGMEYSSDYWSLEVTEAGRAEVEHHMESCPELYA
jgi:hypothetical protein